MATYVNNLRLTELATGEGSGTWGTTTNTSLELIGEALGYNTQNCFSSDADATTTVADGVSDPARSFYFKVTSSATLTATRTLTIAPNTLSRVMFIENATTGSQSIAISQGSGANVTIATGKTAVVYLDGAGSTAAVVDAMAGVDPGITDTLAEVLVAGNTSSGTNIELTTTDKVQFRDSAIFLNSSADGQLDIVADTEVQIAATTIDINGNVDISGTAGVGGVLTANAGVTSSGTGTFGILTVDDISINNASITSSGGITLDAPANIVFDAGGANFYLKDDGTTFGQIIHESPNFTIKSTVSDGDLLFKGNDGGSTITALTFDMSAAGFATFKSGAVFNEDSADSDFRVESDSNANMFKVDAGNNRVGVGLDPTNTFEVKSSGSNINEITLQHSGNTVDIVALGQDNNHGSVHVKKNNGLTSHKINAADGVVFNDDSTDQDFRVEGNSNSNLFTVDASTDRVAVGTEGPVSLLEVGSSTGSATITPTEMVISTRTSASDWATGASNQWGILGFYKADTSGGGAQNVAQIGASMSNSTAGYGNLHFQMANPGSSYAQTSWLTLQNSGSSANRQVVVDAEGGLSISGDGLEFTKTDGISISAAESLVINIDSDDNDSGRVFQTQTGSGLVMMTNSETSGSVFNDGSNSEMDFRVESDSSTHALFVDAGNDAVGLFTSAPATALDVRIGGEGTPPSTVAPGLGAGIFLENNSGAASPYFASKTHNPGDSTAIGGVKFATSPDGANYNWAGVLAENSASGNAGRLRFYTSNANNSGDASTLRMSIMETGRVGINVSAPIVPFAVAGTPDTDYGVANFSGGDGNETFLTLSRDGSQSGGFKVLRGTTADLRLYVQSDEASILNYNGGNTGDSFNIVQGAGTGALVATFDSGNNIIFNENSGDQDFRVESNNNANMLFVDGGNDSVVIGGTRQQVGTLEVIQKGGTVDDGLGILGIGGDTSCRIFTSSNTTQITRGSTKAISIGSSANVVINEDGGDQDFRVESDSNANMFCVNAGNNRVGIGTNSGTANLQIVESANKSESEAHFQITGAGYSGIHWLDGAAYYIGQNSSSRSLRFYSGAETAGAQLSNGATSFTTFSDERLKYDVEPIENALDSLSGLRTVKYRLEGVDSPSDKKKLGVIAQDLVGVHDEVLDSMTRSNDDTEYMGVRYTELVPVLIKAMQEQTEIINDLRARVAQLENT